MRRRTKTRVHVETESSRVHHHHHDDPTPPSAHLSNYRPVQALSTSRARCLVTTPARSAIGITSLQLGQTASSIPGDGMCTPSSIRRRALLEDSCAQVRLTGLKCWNRSLFPTHCSRASECPTQAAGWLFRCCSQRHARVKSCGWAGDSTRGRGDKLCHSEK